jgi:hypothetical protein
MQRLEEVIGSRNKIKLLRFLCQERDWQFNLAAISKIISIDKGALSRLIKDFEQKEVIRTKRSGKLLLFKLNETNSIISNVIIPMFEREGRK